MAVDLLAERGATLRGLGGEALHTLLFRVLKQYSSELASEIHNQKEQRPFSLSPPIRVCEFRHGYAVVPPYYDSLLAKVITVGAGCLQAIKRMQYALDNFAISGVDTVIPFLQFLLNEPDYINGKVNTRWVEDMLDKFSIPQVVTKS